MSLGVLNGIMIFIIGLVFGSFYNVVGYRLPNNMSIISPVIQKDGSLLLYLIYF